MYTLHCTGTYLQRTLLMRNAHFNFEMPQQMFKLINSPTKNDCRYMMLYQRHTVINSSERRIIGTNYRRVYRYMSLPQPDDKIQCTYVWIDGTGEHLREEH